MAYPRKRTSSYASKKRYGYSRKWGSDEYRPYVYGFRTLSPWEKINGRVTNLAPDYPILRKKRW